MADDVRTALDCDCPVCNATIAALRAALDGLVVKVDEYLVGIERGFEHWEAVHPVTGEHLSGDPKVAFLGRDQWYEPTLALRAALATTKQAQCKHSFTMLSSPPTCAKCGAKAKEAEDQ